MNPFSVSGFPARWNCGPGWSEEPWWGWIHIFSDAATSVAYYAVPIVVMYFVTKKRDIRFPPSFFVFLAMIFLSCGTVHLTEATIFWWPIYRFSGIMKLLTALVSCTGVVVLARMLPHVLELKSGHEFKRVVEERKKAQSTLEYERFLLRTLLKHLPDSIYFKDKDGNFTRVSKSLADNLQTTPDELIGKSDADLFEESFARECRADELSVMKSEEPLIQKEERASWPSGKETWALTSKFPLYDEMGVVAGIFGISHDISTQKQATAMFQGIVEASPNPIIVVTEDGNINLINLATERLFGYSRSELIGQSIEKLVPERYREVHVKLRNNYFANPKSRPMASDRELVALRKDTSEVSVEIGLSPIKLVHANAVLACVYDVTLRKQAEQTLIDAKDAAEEANRAKSDFLANMSHEIRTPMNAVIGMTELVLDSELTQPQREYLAIVLESAESLLTIINEILDFSKIEAGKLELEHRNFDLREEIGDTLKALGYRAHAKGLELAWHVAATVPNYLRGDSVRLRQILINLINNSIKFTQEGEVVVRVEQKEKLNSHVVLQFSVSDTGIGIPLEQQAKIFSAFEQADSSTTRQFGGTGLGLAIVSQLALAMGGTAWLESREGEGATFHFTIKLELGIGEPRERIYLDDLSKIKAVVVDDNATNRRILVDMLSNWGIDVVALEGGPQALKLVDSLADDSALPLLVLDVNMPEMDGFTLAERIRATSKMDEAAIIMLTSGGRKGDVSRCEELGIDAHLMKPVKQSELLEAVLTVSGQRASRNTSIAGAKPTARQDENKLRILLVEDGKANQVVAMGLLKHGGHDVVVAEDGTVALERLAAQSFDLVLMDVQMPVMDGIEATRRIREQESSTGAHLPIIAMTARAMKGDREKCLNAGMDDYLSKPVRRNELFRAIEKCMRGRESVQSDSNQPPSVSVDWNEVLQSVDNDREVLLEVLVAFEEECPQLLETMEVAFANSDETSAKRAAHTLKSSVQMLGALELSQRLQQVEHDTLDQSRDRIADLKSAVAELLDQVAQFKRTL